MITECKKTKKITIPTKSKKITIPTNQKIIIKKQNITKKAKTKQNKQKKNQTYCSWCCSLPQNSNSRTIAGRSRQKIIQNLVALTGTRGNLRKRGGKRRRRREERGEELHKWKSSNVLTLTNNNDTA